MMEKQYYIVAVIYGQRGELCFWRENDKGYTNDLNQAGKYSESDVRNHLSYYHNGDHVAIECDKLEEEFTIRLKVDTNYEKIKKYTKFAERKILNITEARAL